MKAWICGVVCLMFGVTGCGNAEFNEAVEVGQQQFDTRDDGKPVVYDYQFLDSMSEQLLHEGVVRFGTDYDCNGVSYQTVEGRILNRTEPGASFCSTPGDLTAGGMTPTLFLGWVVEFFDHEHWYAVDDGAYQGSRIDVYMRRSKREDVLCSGSLSDEQGTLREVVEIECSNFPLKLVLSPQAQDEP